MRRLSTSLTIVMALTAACAASGALAQSNGDGAQVGKWGYLVNVNAFDNCPAGDFLDSNRRQIAVQANYTGNAADKTTKINKIFLRSGTDFWVQDGNACDSTGAYFYLPITAANCSNCGDPSVTPTFTEYEVRARILGKPHSSVTVTSCVEWLVDGMTPETLCSVGSGNVWVGTRTTGGGKVQNSWDNVSTELLTVCIDTIPDDGITACDTRVGLFDPRGQDYWWNWDTTGRPHVQLVFFPVQSGVR
jgi:hypothetical protein